MLTIRYDRNGTPYADEMAESIVVDNAFSSRDREIITSTENIVLMARVLVAEGHINRENIRISWNGIDMYIDSDGRFQNWQDSFSGVFDQCLDRLLNARERIARSDRTVEGISMTAPTRRGRRG